MMVSHDVDVGALVAAFNKRMVVLPPADAVAEQARLKYLGRLLRRARQPLCPINGILTLLPYDQIERSPREAIEVEQAVKQDLVALRHELKLRCPVTAIVVGWDHDSGFRELVRRVGADRARNQRFGKGFALWAAPTPSQLEAVSIHACGAFEDWVYALFREAGALTKPGNTQLYAMLCNVRRHLQSRLASILAKSFAQERETIAVGNGTLFGGCYFAAVGETEDRQAFVKGVLDKLVEQQEELEWTPEALADESRYWRLALVLWSTDALLLTALIGTLAYKLLV
jgi:type VI protein secretion system component VasK